MEEPGRDGIPPWLMAYSLRPWPPQLATSLSHFPPAIALASKSSQPPHEDECVCRSVIGGAAAICDDCFNMLSCSDATSTSASASS